MTAPREITKRDCCLSDAVRGEASEYRATMHVAAYREACVGEERKQFACDLMALPTFTAEYDVATGTRHRAVAVEHVQALIEKLRSGT